jgi:hypothetical protein
MKLNPKLDKSLAYFVVVMAVMQIKRNLQKLMIHLRQIIIFDPSKNI